MSNDRTHVPARGLRILIADDNARIRLLVRTMLADLKAEFHEAWDGQSAVESARAHPPDWVLMDFKMKPVNPHISQRLRLKAKFAPARG